MSEEAAWFEAQMYTLQGMVAELPEAQQAEMHELEANIQQLINNSTDPRLGYLAITILGLRHSQNIGEENGTERSN